MKRIKKESLKVEGTVLPDDKEWIHVRIPVGVAIIIAKSVGLKFTPPEVSVKCPCKEKQGEAFIWGNEC